MNLHINIIEEDLMIRVGSKNNYKCLIVSVAVKREAHYNFLVINLAEIIVIVLLNVRTAH